jgi:hypothetical protein
MAIEEDSHQKRPTAEPDRSTELDDRAMQAPGTGLQGGALRLSAARRDEALMSPVSDTTPPSLNGLSNDDRAAIIRSPEPTPNVSSSSSVLCPNVSDADSVTSVIDSVFLHCLNRRYTFSQHKRSRTTTMIRTKLQEVLAQVDAVQKQSYADAVFEINRTHTAAHSTDMQKQYLETVYWGIIKKAAENIDPKTCPTPKGPLDGFTRQEKKAQKEFMEKAGISPGRETERTCRWRWKRLHDIRESGVVMMLFYRTSEFTNFCEKFDKDADQTLIETVQSWEDKYGPQLVSLERRIQTASQDDLTGKLWLSQIAHNVTVKEDCWKNDRNDWHSGEEADFTAMHGSPSATSDQQGGLHDIPSAKCRKSRNMSLFVILDPRGTEQICVCSIVTIKQDDFLGVFAGEIRYSESFDETWGIGGPLDKLWLDYSKITGLLNQMRVSPPGGDANVQLRWERYIPPKEDQPIWRVEVRALREIKPFEDMVRSAHHDLQYQMHQDPICAKVGFSRPRPSQSKSCH